MFLDVREEHVKPMEVTNLELKMKPKQMEEFKSMFANDLELMNTARNDNYLFIRKTISNIERSI